jgi:hypothetical protein
VGDQVSHPYKAPYKIILLYASGVIFLNKKEENKRFWIEWQPAFPEFSRL